MSEDKNESRAEAHADPGDVWGQIKKLSGDISEVSSTFREKAVEISQKIAEVAAVAGFYYGDEKENWWEYDPSGQPEKFTSRIAVWKDKDFWVCGVEETTNWPQYWDGSNYKGWENPFEECIHPTAECMSRRDLAEFVKRLPQFLENYLNYLKGRHAKYSHVKKLSEALSDVLERV